MPDKYVYAGFGTREGALHDDYIAYSERCVYPIVCVQCIERALQLYVALPPGQMICCTRHHYKDVCTHKYSWAFDKCYRIGLS
jgi:hypothetical protein